jgi:hypothetical protein
VTKAVVVRDAAVPETLVVLRMGSTTLSDNALVQACERAYAAMGLHAFSVFEIPDHDYAELARLEPILITRPKVLEASGPELVAAGFALLPTGRFPHWSVVLSEPTAEQFARVRSHFRGPIDNPTWTGRSV